MPSSTPVQPKSPYSTTLKAKTNQLDTSGTSQSFSQDDTIMETVPEQVSESHEATEGSHTYSNNLATASASTVSSIASTEESVDKTTLDEYGKEARGATVTTDEMTTNNLSDSPVAATTGGASVSTSKPQQSGKYVLLLYLHTCVYVHIDKYM